MSRNYNLWRSWFLVFGLVSGLGWGCSNGGSFDPLDNVGGNNQAPPPSSVTSVLPDCSATVPAPCKIAFSDLSFTEDPGCQHKSDTTLGMTWNNPGGGKDKVQFGASEAGTLQACANFEHKQCDMTLSAPPSLFATVQASKVRLSFSEKHKLFLYISTAGSTINGTGVATATLRFGGNDALTIAGTRNASGGGLDLSPVSAWLNLKSGADRTIGLRITTDCGQVFAPNLPIFWSIEGMTAEMLP